MKLKETYISFKLTLSKNRVLTGSVKLFIACIAVALLAPVLANDKPLICNYKNTWMFPAFSFKNKCVVSNHELINYDMGKEWKLIHADFILFSPCSYSPNTIDAENAPRKSPFDEQVITYKGQETCAIPFKFRHWLGTTQNGNDVLSCIIHGTSIAISIGIFSMLIAAIIGICLGASAGYFENTGLKIGYIQAVFLALSIFLIYFYGCVVNGEKLATAFNRGGAWLIIGLLGFIYLLFKMIVAIVRIGRYFDRKFQTEQKLNFPIDTVVSRTIEVLNSIPSLLLIIAVSAIAKPSYGLLILIIGLLSWPGIARLARAEFLKVKRLDYVTSCKAIGMENKHIILKHILPNTLPILLVPVVFGMGAAVLAEASLSFIGIGVPVNSASWGSLLNEGRDHFSSWWLVVFPGLCIFTLILIYNTIATHLAKPGRK